MKKSTEQRILYLLKSKGAQTAGDVGIAFGITMAGAQQNLAKLASSGLINAEDRKHGRGRPKRYWNLTDKGHTHFPDRHSDLTLEILTSTEKVFGKDGLALLIRHREAETLDKYIMELKPYRTLKERVMALTRLRSREGYMADCLETEDGKFLLVENHCPICAAAELCLGLCNSELSIFRSALGPDAHVERTEHILQGARRCAYIISSVRHN